MQLPPDDKLNKAVAPVLLAFLLGVAVAGLQFLVAWLVWGC